MIQSRILTRKTTWKQFFKSHWDVLTACDSFSIELLVRGQLIRCMVFFAIERNCPARDICSITAGAG